MGGWWEVVGRGSGKGVEGLDWFGKNGGLAGKREWVGW